MPEKLTFASIDRILIFIYFIFLVVLGIINYRSRSNQEEFLIAGRRLSIGAFIATLVSTFYGGILGVGEFTFRHGLVSWLTQGFFYYLLAIVYALFLAPKIRCSNNYTLPDQLYNHYNRSTGLIGSFFTFILVSPAPYVLMSGIMIQIIFGLPLFYAILVGTLFSTVYVMIGGFRSVVRTDILQFGLMFFGFGLVIPFAWTKLGSLSSILSHLPEGHTNLFGKLSLQQIIAWGFISLWTIVSPSFYQRCSAAKTESVAKKGILLAVFFWFIFDMMTLSAGYYARYAFSNIDPIMAYPFLGQLVLPPFFKGLFFIGMLATIMSSLDSMAFLSAITLGRDFIWRLKISTEQNLSFYTRIGLIISAAFAVVIAVKFKSVINIWYGLGSLAIPILFLPLVTTFFPKYKLQPRSTFGQMLTTSLFSLSWLVIGYMNSNNGVPVYPFTLEPMYPGLIVSLTWWVLAKWKETR